MSNLSQSVKPAQLLAGTPALVKYGNTIKRVTVFAESCGVVAFYHNGVKNPRLCCVFKNRVLLSVGSFASPLANGLKTQFLTSLLNENLATR